VLEIDKNVGRINQLSGVLPQRKRETQMLVQRSLVPQENGWRRLAQALRGDLSQSNRANETLALRIRDRKCRRLSGVLTTVRIRLRTGQVTFMSRCGV